MNFNFDWNYVSAGAPYVTISEKSLSFNSPTVSLLGNPDEVIIGFDKNNEVIGVKRYDDNEKGKAYKFYGRMKNGWVRVGCKDFINHLSFLTGIDFSSAKRYIAKYDEKEQVVYVCVTDNDSNKQRDNKND